MGSFHRHILPSYLTPHPPKKDRFLVWTMSSIENACDPSTWCSGGDSSVPEMTSIEVYKPQRQNVPPEPSGAAAAAPPALNCSGTAPPLTASGEPQAQSSAQSSLTGLLLQDMVVLAVPLSMLLQQPKQTFRDRAMH
jgi:hypothetical protein